MFENANFVGQTRPLAILERLVWQKIRSNNYQSNTFPTVRIIYRRGINNVSEILIPKFSM